VPKGRRWDYAGAAAATMTLALVVLLVVSSRTAVDAALLGSGNSAISDTAVSALHLPDGFRLFVSRFLPLEIALAMAWWAAERLGPDVLEPVPLMSLAALSLSLRLVFEVNMWGYYYMALTVALVLLDVVGGRIRAALLAWLAAVSVVYLVGPRTARVVWTAVSCGPEAQRLLAPIVAALALVLASVAVARRHQRDALCWLALAVAAVMAWPAQHNLVGRHVSPACWQLALVLLGLALAAGPLLGEVRARRALAGAGEEPTPSPRATTSIHGGASG